MRTRPAVATPRPAIKTPLERAPSVDEVARSVNGDRRAGITRGQRVANDVIRSEFTPHLFDAGVGALVLPQDEVRYITAAILMRAKTHHRIRGSQQQPLSRVRDFRPHARFSPDPQFHTRKAFAVVQPPLPR
jgi:hypothetical protein